MVAFLMFDADILIATLRCVEKIHCFFPRSTKKKSKKKSQVYNRTWTSSTCNNRSKLHLFHALVVPTLTYGVATYPWTKAVRDALNSTYNKMLRYALNDPVDWQTFQHTPIEELMGERLYLSALVVYHRLREHGHWVRQHFREEDDNPVRHALIDVFSWETQDSQSIHYRRGGALLQGSRDGLLHMVRVLSYAEVCELAMKKRRWRGVVESEALREQLSVASVTSARRFTENRCWSEDDHRLLLARARILSSFIFHHSPRRR